MIRREGRVDPTHADTAPGSSVREDVGVHTWERAIFVAALVVILMLGAIGGVNAIIGMFPR